MDSVGRASFPASLLPVERVSLSDQVRNLLLERLTSGLLRPGDRINEAELARNLGISRNPIREAISGLAQRGFLVASPGRGHFLRLFSRKDVDDVFSFRICVETFAIREALPRMQAADHARLADILERMFVAAGAAQLAPLLEADLALHRRICELSGNGQLLRAHTAIDTEVRMLIASVDLDRESPMESALSHVPIVEALGTGNADASVAAMTTHLETNWARVIKIYEEKGVGEFGGGRRHRPTSSDRHEEMRQ